MHIPLNAELPVAYNRMTGQAFMDFKKGLLQDVVLLSACDFLQEHILAMNAYLGALPNPLCVEFAPDEEIIVGSWGFFSHSKFEDYGWLSFLYIYPECRRKRLGLAVINALVKTYGRLFWECRSGNHEAMLFYSFWKMIPSFREDNYLYCADSVIRKG